MAYWNQLAMPCVWLSYDISPFSFAGQDKWQGACAMVDVSHGWCSVIKGWIFYSVNQTIQFWIFCWELGGFLFLAVSWKKTIGWSVQRLVQVEVLPQSNATGIVYVHLKSRSSLIFNGDWGLLVKWTTYVCFTCCVCEFHITSHLLCWASGKAGTDMHVLYIGVSYSC